jgi:starch phosphorylase
LQPADVRIEFVARRQLPESSTEPPPLSSYNARANAGLWIETLNPTGEHENDHEAVFALDAQPTQCGQFATEVRIYPWHELLTHPFELGLLKRI